jgi:methylglutaconyl-CoA hydratase
MPNLIQTETVGGIATIRLNRPEKRNAQSIALLEALCEAVERASEDPAARVIVLRGSGPVFCAGLDLEEVADPALSARQAQLLVRTLSVLYHAPKVTIARVHGAALAGGAALMAACDIAVATVDSLFGYPAVKRGLVAALAMPLIRRQIGERHARELMLLGEIIDAGRAQEIGLITRGVPSDLLDEQIALFADLVVQAGPEAVRQSKRGFNETGSRSVDDELHAALQLHLETCSSAEATEGTRAFLEKRAPKWHH